MRKVLLSLSAFLFILTVQAQEVTHLVKQGESLYSLAKKHNTTIDAIIKQNNLGGNGIKIGQKLILPNSTNVSAKTESPSTPTGTAVKARVHTVVKGESLYAITKKYGIMLQDLKAWNNINETNIQPGQKLVVSKVDQSAIYNPPLETKKAEQ
jgi:LysM repeat protein